jgi:small subunit ribosomal protein S18
MQKRKGKERRRRQERAPKICRLCENKINYVDFLDPDLLRKFQSEKGRILPSRITGTCPIHQKMLSEAIKRARILSLVY